METKNGMIEEFKAREAKKAVAKTTMAKKAKTYRKFIRTSFTTACITATIFMFCLSIYLITRKNAFLPITIITGIIMDVNLLAFIAAIVAKKIWEWKLLKIGLMIPPELEQ